EQYSPHHWRRLEIRPGITGEWQVHGRSRIRDFEQVVELDLRYQERWSVAYDLQLLGKTILAIFTKNGAC
ncbi:MAG: sugar transferase, partial [Chloroflexaceae bacterium]|nr:sugar transferase [Chloroflexaceae bacterium]